MTFFCLCVYQLSRLWSFPGLFSKNLWFELTDERPANIPQPHRFCKLTFQLLPTVGFQTLIMWSLGFAKVPLSLSLSLSLSRSHSLSLALTLTYSHTHTHTHQINFDHTDVAYFKCNVTLEQGDPSTRSVLVDRRLQLSALQDSSSQLPSLLMGPEGTPPPIPTILLDSDPRVYWAVIHNVALPCCGWISITFMIQTGLPLAPEQYFNVTAPDRSYVLQLLLWGNLSHVVLIHQTEAENWWWDGDGVWIGSTFRAWQ